MTQQFHSEVSFQEKTCAHKNLYANAQSCIIHNSPKVEATTIFTNWEVGKQNIFYLCNGILFSNEKEQHADTCYDTTPQA